MIRSLLVSAAVLVVFIVVTCIATIQQSVTASPGSSQTGEWVCWDPTSANPCRHDLNAVSVVSKTEAWAVGDYGHIQRWDGHSWVRTESSVATGLWGIDMVSPRDGWAVGGQDGILRWDGQTWSPFTRIPDGIGLQSIDMVAADDGWAAGSNGFVRWDGYAWTRAPFPLVTNGENCYIDVIASDDGWALYGGSVGNQESDAPPAWHWDGRKWSNVALDTPPEYSLNGISMVSATDGWIVGYRSEVDRFVAGTAGLAYRWDGTRWTLADAGPAISGIWFAVSALGSGDVWATGLDMARFTNGDWSLLDQPSGIPFDIEMLTSDHGWAVGHLGVTFHWDGERWTARGGSNDVTLHSVYMVAADKGWAVGAHIAPDNAEAGAIYEWDGATWTHIAGIADEPLRAVDFVDANNGWAVGDVGLILRWNGHEWAPATSGTVADLLDVSALAEDDVWAVGTNGTILHWNGATWTAVVHPVPDHETVQAVDFVAPEDGWAAWRYDRMLHWNGYVWSEAPLPTLNWITDIQMLSSDLGWAVGERGVFRWDGKHWTEIAPIDFLSSVIMTAPDRGWAASRFGALYRWDGSVWHEESHLTDTPINDLAASPNGEAWAAGAAGMLLRYLPDGVQPSPTRVAPTIGSLHLPNVRR